MVKIAVIADPHLPVGQDSSWEDEAALIRTSIPDDVDFVIGLGDYAMDVNTFPIALKEMVQPYHQVYFIVGNHDMYGGYSHRVDVEMGHLKRESRGNLHPVISAYDIPAYFDGETKWNIIGSNLLYDMRAGLGWETHVKIKDMQEIYDLQGFRGEALSSVVRRIADMELDRVLQQLDIAYSNGERDFIWLTHCPPTRAAYYDGEPTDEDHLPWFANDKLDRWIKNRLRKDYPNANIHMFAGHTHNTVRVRVDSGFDIRVVKTDKEVYVVNVEKERIVYGA